MAAVRGIRRLSPGIIGRLRLAAQGLLGPGFQTVPDAVRGMTAMQAQDLQAVLWAVGPARAGFPRRRRPRRTGPGGDRPVLANARHLARAGTRGLEMDAGHHLRPADPGHGRAPPGARDRRRGRRRRRGNRPAAGLRRRLPAGRSCSRPSNGRVSPRRASAAFICSGSCASGGCWCRARWPATSSWSWPSTTGSPSRGPWTVRTASPSGCCATCAVTAPPRNVILPGGPAFR